MNFKTLSLKSEFLLAAFLLFSFAFIILIFRRYQQLKASLSIANERCPLVQSQGFSEHHPFFGKPVNGCDLFYGSRRDELPNIIQKSFDEYFHQPAGYFGCGAYFQDDTGLSMSFVDQDIGCIFVCSAILGVQDASHWRNPLDVALSRDFRPEKGIHSILGRVNVFGSARQSEYIVYRPEQCKPVYLLVFRH